MKLQVLVSIFLIALVTITNGALDKKTIQGAVTAYKNVNTAENVGKIIRLGCSG